MTIAPLDAKANVSRTPLAVVQFPRGQSRSQRGMAHDFIVEQINDLGEQHAETKDHSKAALFTACVPLLAVFYPAYDDNPILSNSQLTPGSVLTTNFSKIGRPGYTKTIRYTPS